MIDFYSISVDTPTPVPIGKPVTVDQSADHKTRSFTSVKASAGATAPQFHLQYDHRNKRLKFWGSPAQFLQGHNAYGSNDLRWLVRETIPLVCRTIQLELPNKVMRSINTGNYRVHETHITEHFSLRDVAASAADVCDWIRRFAPSSYQATALRKGIGVRLFPDSRSREFLIYDKAHYYTDNTIRHRLGLMGNQPPQSFERIGTSLLFDRMCAELGDVLRIECRFKRKLSAKAYELGTGVAWSAAKAEQLFRDTVAELQFGDVPASSALEAFVADPSEPQAHRTAVALWLAHRDVQQLSSSDAAYYRLRKHLLTKLGIDLSAPYISSAPFGWNSLTDWSNRIPTPKWAAVNHYIHTPETAEEGIAAPYQRAWLDHVRAA